LLVRRTSPVFPGHTGRDLLASDDAVVDETVNGRRCDAKRGRRTFDGQKITCLLIRPERSQKPLISLNRLA
jgi:hypothetical protein